MWNGYACQVIHTSSEIEGRFLFGRCASRSSDRQKKMKEVQTKRKRKNVQERGVQACSSFLALGFILLNFQQNGARLVVGRLGSL